MKYNPITKTLFTDDNQLLKKMHCPYKMDWNNLESTSQTTRSCTTCQKPIYDAMQLSDNELLDIFKQNPDTCVKIDINSIIITNHV